MRGCSLLHCQPQRSSLHLSQMLVWFPTSYVAFMAQRSRNITPVVYRHPTRDPKTRYLSNFMVGRITRMHVTFRNCNIRRKHNVINQLIVWRRNGNLTSYIFRFCFKGNFMKYDRGGYEDVETQNFCSPPCSRFSFFRSHPPLLSKTFQSLNSFAPLRKDR